MPWRLAVLLCALSGSACGLDLGPTPTAVPAPTGNSTFGILMADGVTDERADLAARMRCRIDGHSPIFVTRVRDIRAYRCTTRGYQ